MHAALGTPVQHVCVRRGMTVPHFAMRARSVIARPGTGAHRSSDDSAQESASSRPARGLALLGRHWLIALLLAAGLALRVVSWMAYHPALLYVDTLKYLYKEWPGADPLAYKLVLKVILFGTNLGTVAALQHLAGLAMAVTIYLVLVRRGCVRWLAALAAAPVLLDAYQLQMEQTIMPDVLFEVMIVAGLAVLLWRPVVSFWAVVIGGLILGASATVAQVGEILIVPAVVFMLFTGGGWRKFVSKAVVVAVAFLFPILAYCLGSAYLTGHFWLASGADADLGRVAVSVDCATLKGPAYLRAMCPTPKEQANGADWLEHSKYSPLHDPVIPATMTRGEAIAKFEGAVEHQQPLRVVGSFLRDSIRLFAGSRQAIQGITPISRWQFQTHYPTYSPEVTLGAHNQIIVGIQRAPYEPFHQRLLKPSYGGAAQVDKPLASFLRTYQLDGGYTPGPLLALATLLGVIGSLFVLRRRGDPRQRQLALACLLFFGAAATVLLVSDFTEFSWRYQLPALVTLPPAGALGAMVLVRGFTARRARGSQTGEQEAASPAEQPGAVS
jgi:hypothetical protein